MGLLLEKKKWGSRHIKFLAILTSLFVGLNREVAKVRLKVCLCYTTIRTVAYRNIENKCCNAITAV